MAREVIEIKGLDASILNLRHTHFLDQSEEEGCLSCRYWQDKGGIQTFLCSNPVPVPVS